MQALAGPRSSELKVGCKSLLAGACMLEITTFHRYQNASHALGAETSTLTPNQRHHYSVPNPNPPIQGFDTIFIHVGTQRKKAGLEGQIALEYDHTLAVCMAAKEGGCR